MKKFLSIIMVASLLGMVTSAFAFVPLSNVELNIGSYQRSATRGMFYNELDIVSAAPVELLDFSGNALYTNWGNMRSFAGPYTAGTYNRALSWTGATEPINIFTFGVTGNPLSYAGINDSRSGIVYQNFGVKTTPFNLDNNVATGRLPNTGINGEDSEGNWSNSIYTLIYATAPATDELVTASGDGLKYDVNTTNTQWNVGSSYKLMDKISLGLSLERMTNTSILTTEGTKTYTDRYTTSDGAIAAGSVKTATEARTYNVTYPSQSADQASASDMTILPQARINIADDLNVDVGIGADFIKDMAVNPASADNLIGVNEKTTITATAREEVVVSTGGAGALNQNGVQYFNTGTAIVGKAAVAGINLDYNNVLNIGPAMALNTNVFKAVGALGTQSGVSDFKDDRDGMAPVLRIEAKKKFEKVDVTGVFNWSSLSRDVDASVTNREYVQSSCVISTNNAGAWANGNLKTDNFVERDYTANTSFTGTAKDGNLDVGAKVAMKALEGVRVSFGGFIHRNAVKTETDWTRTGSNTISYDDGISSTMTWSGLGAGGSATGGILASSGSISALTLTTPGPVVNPGIDGIYGTGDDVLGDESASRLGYGMSTTGNGEGTWVQTTSQAGTYDKETVTLAYSVPVGIEIPLSKKWTFRAGTEYVITKTEITEETVNGVEYGTITATPRGGAVETGTAVTTNPTSTKSVYRSEQHDVFYTYGIQFDATPSLTIACNAFLDTNSLAATDASGTSNANFFDLATYRQLSLSASIKF